MVLWQRKTIVALVTVALVLTAGASVWLAVVAGKKEKRPPEKPVRAELNKSKEKPPARVGQIFITGNKIISDDIFLKALDLFPGQILTYPALQIAEKKLSRLKGLKSSPKVSVLDREGDGEFKDIQITVEEK